jgi:hypothetical protein
MSQIISLTPAPNSLIVTFGMKSTSVERCSPERQAEFLLSTATTRADYERVRRLIKKWALILMLFPTGGRPG